MTSFAFLKQLSIAPTKSTDVNRLRGQALAAAYLAVWMNLMTPLPCPRQAKFRLTML